LIRLRKYLKPYILLILLSFILLFGQGMADLFLPELMSDIVNVGIQRSGIEHSSPDVISPQGFEMAVSFMTEEQSKIVHESYTSVKSGSEKYKNLSSSYENLGDEVYVLKDDADREYIDDAFSHSGFTVMMTAADFASLMGENNNNSTFADSSDMDVKMLYIFTSLPMFVEVSKQHIDDAQSTDITMTESIGAAMAKLYYKELGADLGAVQTGYIFKVGIKMIAVTLAGVIASIILSFLASKISSGVARKLRSDVFRKVESFSNAEFDRFSTASLITRTTNDITQVQNIVNMGIRMICYAPILGIGGAILAASTTMSMGWIIILAIVLLLAIMLIVFIVAMPKFRLLQKLIDRLNLVTRESLNGISVIRAFGTENYEIERFDKANTDLMNVNLFVNRVMTFLMPAMTLIMNGVSMLVVWVGSHQIERAEIQVGDMMAFIQYSMMIIMSFLMIAVMFIIVPRASVSGDRIADVLECEISVKDPEEPKKLSEVKGEIEFENVCFRYNGAEKDVLSDISFKAKPGMTTAIIGTTGSGKTTLLNLIPRFYDVTQGSVKIDGVDVREITQHDLREAIGMVPQKGMLFSGNIKSNLLYGRKDAGDDEIAQAAKIAQAEEFILEKPEKFSSPIAQGGTNVSGGQKQRLAIARALVKKAPVYLFDDSFSALDFKTDAALRKALKKYTGSATVIIVAQRISTIMHAENILVLDGGKIVGRGTHNDLLKNCEQYREIAVSQNSANEI